MADITENPIWEDGVFQIELDTPVKGGPDGPDNLPHKQLANRTLWLRQQVDAHAQAIDAKAPRNSPEFTGTPRAPTPPGGDNSSLLATTAYVAWALSVAQSYAQGDGAFGTHGWRRLPSGLIIQWGQTSVVDPGPATGPSVATFPIAFPTACLQAVGTPATNQNGSFGIVDVRFNNTSISFTLEEWTVVVQQAFVRYFAVGH